MASEEKKAGFFKRAARKIANFFREMKSELKKVVWPSKKDVLHDTLVVIA